MAELLSCDNVMPSLSPTFKTQKSLIKVLQILVSFGSELCRQRSAFFVQKSEITTIKHCSS